MTIKSKTRRMNKKDIDKKGESARKTKKINAKRIVCNSCKKRIVDDSYKKFPQFNLCLSCYKKYYKYLNNRDINKINLSFSKFNDDFLNFQNEEKTRMNNINFYFLTSIIVFIMLSFLISSFLSIKQYDKNEDNILLTDENVTKESYELDDYNLNDIYDEHSDYSLENQDDRNNIMNNFMNGSSKLIEEKHVKSNQKINDEEIKKEEKKKEDNEEEKKEEAKPEKEDDKTDKGFTIEQYSEIAKSVATDSFGDIGNIKISYDSNNIYIDLTIKGLYDVCNAAINNKGEDLNNWNSVVDSFKRISQLYRDDMNNYGLINYACFVRVINDTNPNTFLLSIKNGNVEIDFVNNK